MKVLVISDPSDIAFEPVSLELITAARTVCGDDGEVTVAALGHPTEAKEQFGAADKVVGLLSETEGLPTAEAAQAALASLVAEDRPDVVLVAHGDTLQIAQLVLAARLVGRAGPTPDEARRHREYGMQTGELREVGGG